jgi:hypothetical protein
LWGGIGLEADAEPRAGGLGEALKRPGRRLDPPAFETRDRRLRPIAAATFASCHPGPTAGLDQGGGELLKRTGGAGATNRKGD